MVGTEHVLAPTPILPCNTHPPQLTLAVKYARVLTGLGILGSHAGIRGL